MCFSYFGIGIIIIRRVFGSVKIRRITEKYRNLTGDDKLASNAVHYLVEGDYTRGLLLNLARTNSKCAPLQWVKVDENWGYGKSKSSTLKFNFNKLWRINQVDNYQVSDVTLKNVGKSDF